MRISPALVFAVLTLHAAVDAQPRGPVYETDIKFLLEELEKKAGPLLQLKGVDWKAVRVQFLKDVKKVRTDEEHVKLASRLVARLRDGHATLVDLKSKGPDESKGRRFTGPRVLLVSIKGKLYVRQAFESAEKAGIFAGMEVEKIGGQAADVWLKKTVERLSDETGFSTPQMAIYHACHAGLADWEGTPIDFDLRSPAGKKHVRIVRRGGPNFAPVGPVFPPAGLKQEGRQSCGKTAGGFGYIHLRDVPADLPEQLDRMLAAIGDVPGLILDCRANGGGGCDHAAVFGRFIPEGKTWRQYRSAGQKPYGGPMVVIVDAGVRSAGETIAGQFKEDGRAYMIGDTPTAGMSSQKEKLAVPSGLFSAYFSVGSNKGRFNNGKGIEGIGVSPHEMTPYDSEDLLKRVDTQIRRAEEILNAGIPVDKVPYGGSK